MSKNTSILIIIGTFLLIVGGLIFFYVSSNNSGNISPTTQATSSPFGDNSGDRTIDTNTQTTDFINKNNNIKKDQLIQLYKNPTSGSVFVTNKNNKTVVKFVDRAVGNIYQYVPGIENGEVTRITNTTIPKIQETVWSSTIGGTLPHLNEYGATSGRSTSSEDAYLTLASLARAPRSNIGNQFVKTSTSVGQTSDATIDSIIHALKDRISVNTTLDFDGEELSSTTTVTLILTDGTRLDTEFTGDTINISELNNE